MNDDVDISLYYTDKEDIRDLIDKCIKSNKIKGKIKENFPYKVVNSSLEGFNIFIYRCYRNINKCPCVFLSGRTDLDKVFELIETFFEIGKQATERKYKF